jgi:hypothetical protein
MWELQIERLANRSRFRMDPSEQRIAMANAVGFNLSNTKIPGPTELLRVRS